MIITNCKKEWQTIGFLRRIIEYFQKDISDRSKKKRCPEVAFCNKKGIYNVDYNWKFLQDDLKIPMRNVPLLK